MNNYPLSAGVIGASGYTGRELVQLVRRHPRLGLAWATSESEAGSRLNGTSSLTLQRAEDVDLGSADIVFSCLPTGESAPWVARARAVGAKVVDLSADLRPDIDHGPQGIDGAVYGLPELWRDDIRGAGVVANPGCYPTGALLCLWPLLRSGLVDTDRATIVDAASGVTGAGRSARRDLLFGEVAEDYRAYGVGNEHRHVPELAAGLARALGGSVPDFVFTPHLLPVRRGILETTYVPLRGSTTAQDVAVKLSEFYAVEPFVEVLDGGLPSLASVVGTNMVSIGISPVSRLGSPLAICVVAFDNLLKGAAGQALQNANLMLGLPEAEGLLDPGSSPDSGNRAGRKPSEARAQAYAEVSAC